MAHAAEWGRFYYPDGKPAYEVPNADGSKMITPDIRHAKKLGLVPSVTTIIQEAAKPGLERWKQEQVLHAALTLPLIEGESEKDYLSRIMRDSQEQAKKAAERGTAIHAAIQCHYEGQPPADEYMVFVKAVKESVGKWASAHPDNASWDTERSFASLGFGGKVDLSADSVVLDFKTKEFSATDKKLAWDEQCLQLAAYREGLGMPTARCANVYVSVNNPGLVHIHEWKEDELKRGWEMFKALLDYFYARTGLARPSNA